MQNLPLIHNRQLTTYHVLSVCLQKGEDKSGKKLRESFSSPIRFSHYSSKNQYKILFSSQAQRPLFNLLTFYQYLQISDKVHIS